MHSGSTAAAAGWASPLPADTWSEVEAAAAQLPDATLKLLVTRGNALARGYAPDGGESALRVLYAFAGCDARATDEPVQVIRLNATLGENPLLAGLKHTSRLEQVLARAEMRGRGAFEGLMASSTGLLISGTMTNVFLRIKGEWMTPETGSLRHRRHCARRRAA